MSRGTTTEQDPGPDHRPAGRAVRPVPVVPAFSRDSHSMPRPAARPRCWGHVPLTGLSAWRHRKEPCPLNPCHPWFRSRLAQHGPACGHAKPAALPKSGYIVATRTSAQRKRAYRFRR